MVRLARNGWGRVRGSKHPTNCDGLFRSVFDNSPHGVAIVRSDGRIAETNRALGSLLRYSDSELVGRKFVALAPRGDRAERASVLRAAQEGSGTVSVAEGRLVRSDGTIVWGEVKAWCPLAGGTPGHAIAMIEDITARKLAEERAQRTATTLQIERDKSLAVLSTALDAMMIFNAQGTIESFSSSGETMFGYSQGDVLGHSVDMLVPNYHDSIHSRDSPRTGTSSDARVARELEARHRDGTRFPVQVSLRQSKIGETECFCACIRELTEWKGLHAQLRQAQKMEGLGALATGVAHDFNNVLMGVSGFASVALSSIDVGSAAHMYLSEIKKAAGSGSALTKQLLSFSRNTDVEPRVFELNAAIADQQRMLKRLLGEDIEFCVELNADDSRVRADQGQIGQVLMNLAVNARDAMPEGGRLTIGTSVVKIVAPGEKTENCYVPPGTYVVLEVADDGCGMSAEVCERLFERFYTTKRAGEGTGVGLSIVHDIIRRYDGHIRVHSVEGLGARFEVLLPLRNGEVIEPELPSIAPAGAQGDGTILLCEDDRLVRMGIRCYLERSGYRVLEAQDGVEAIELCRGDTQPIDLLLVAPVLLGQSGERVARAARALRPEIAVLYVPAHAPRLEGQGQIEPELQTLEEPFDEVALLSRIRQALRREIVTHE